MVMIENGWCRDTRTNFTVLDTTIQTTNPYIRNMIIQNHIINDNYHLTIKDDNIILNIKRILERPVATSFAKKAKDMGYHIFSNKAEYSTERCVINGRKVVKENKISIKLLNHLKELDEEKLNTNINVEINKDGYIFIFEHVILDDPNNPMYGGRTIEWWEDWYEDENYFNEVKL